MEQPTSGEAKEDKSEAFGPEWEILWTGILSKDGLQRLCSKFWPVSRPASTYKTVNLCLAKLKEEKCFPTEQVRIWASFGALRDQITWSVADMQRREVVPTGTGAPAPKRRRSDPSGSTQVSDSSTGSMDVEEEEEEDPPVRKVADFTTMPDLLLELRRMGLNDRNMMARDEAKLSLLESLFPSEGLASHSIMGKSERQQLLKSCPSFENLIPHALSKDLSQLSNRLNRFEKAQIQVFYQAQQRVREKLRLILSHLYDEVDTNQPLSRQAAGFRSWLDMFYLCLDDFVWCIKQQQKIIFGKVGLSDVIDSSEASIIPTELKARIEEVSKFREHFNVGRFSFNRDGTRRGSFRSRGSRGLPRFYSSNRGFGRGRFGSSNYALSSERSRSPRRESFNNWSSGTPSRGRGRGREK